MHWHDEDGATSPIRSLITRRLLLQSAGAVAAMAAVAPAVAAKGGAALDFKSIAQDIIPDHRVADGYDAEVLVRWGDGLAKGAPAFEAVKLTAAEQERQFGFNCDFVGYFPLPKGSTRSDHGLLFVNHEYATHVEMLPPGAAVPPPSAEQAALEQAAVGASVVEIKREGGQWRVVPDSAYARRLTARTPIDLAGPVAGVERVRTKADSEGRHVLGTFGNCAGGKTPWGTALTAEENFQGYFVGAIPDGHRETDALLLAQAGLNKLEVEAQAAGAPSQRAIWGQFDTRFDVSIEPREANRFGWMVEVDPYDPASTPVKRTALGRFRHEAANVVVNRDGRVVVYLGEDRAWGFVFRFVSKGRFDPAKGVANGQLLDEGTLYAARFDETSVTWLPLVFGQGVLKAPDFASQADVLIDAHRAAQAVGATPMDRPEDIDTSPVSGHVFLNLTRNNDRKPFHLDAANPRAENEDGHVLELVPPAKGGKLDHAADVFQWSVFLLAGPVAEGGKYGSADSAVLSGPDNLAFDPKGRLWIATDNRRWAFAKPIPNGLFACEVEGPRRAATRFFFNVPAGAEMCGPEFTPDGETLFVAVQHPCEDLRPKPAKSWPDFIEGVPARPSIVAVTRKGGGPIGG